MQNHHNSELNYLSISVNNPVKNTDRVCSHTLGRNVVILHFKTFSLFFSYSFNYFTNLCVTTTTALSSELCYYRQLIKINKI